VRAIGGLCPVLLFHAVVAAKVRLIPVRVKGNWMAREAVQVRGQSYRSDRHV